MYSKKYPTLIYPKLKSLSFCFLLTILLWPATHTQAQQNPGDFIDEFAQGGGLDLPLGLAFGPDGHLYVISWVTDQVYRFNGETGEFIDIFADDINLDEPTDLTFGPDNHLYVSSSETDQILRFNGTSGTFVDVFAQHMNLDGPQTIVFGSDDLLYVVSGETHQILRFDSMGTFVDVFAEGNGLDSPVGMAFGPDSNLYVSSRGATSQVLRYNGTTGEFIDVFTKNGGLIDPFNIAFGPNGDLYVSNGGFTDRVTRFDGETGEFIDHFVPSRRGGLEFPAGLAFGPDGNFYVSSWNTDKILRYVGTNTEAVSALFSIYHDTGGPNWTNNTNWLVGALSTWHGVIVNDAGQVTHLNFLNNQLTGEIPSEIGNLTALQWLELSQNDLSGPIPSEVGNLTELTFFSVFANQLNGSLPAELGNLTKLDHLQLGANTFQGMLPPELGNLTALRFLFAFGNQFEGNIPATFGMLSALTNLDISNNPSMTGTLPIELTGLPLADFWFNGTGLCENLDPEFQSWLATITTLSTSGCTNVATEEEQPNRFALHQNYPNPFNPETQFFFDLPEATPASLIIYNAFGQEVDVVFDTQWTAGSHTYRWQPENLSSGAYFYRLEAGQHVAMGKLLYVK